MEEIIFWSGTYQSVIINLCVPFNSEPPKMSPSKRKTLMSKEKENILKEVDEKARKKGKYVRKRESLKALYQTGFKQGVLANSTRGGFQKVCNVHYPWGLVPVRDDAFWPSERGRHI